MTSRRTFLTALAAGAGAVALRAHSAAATEIQITTGLNGPIGLQLWSLREYLPKDLAGALPRFVRWVSRGRSGRPLEAHAGGASRRPRYRRPAMSVRAHGGSSGAATTPGGHRGSEGHRRDRVVCPWIEHKDAVHERGCDEGGGSLQQRREGRGGGGHWLAYHTHGYEFVPSAEGTLFDTLANAPDPERVSLPVDVFHTDQGGRSRRAHERNTRRA